MGEHVVSTEREMSYEEYVQNGTGRGQGPGHDYSQETHALTYNHDMVEGVTDGQMPVISEKETVDTPTY